MRAIAAYGEAGRATEAEQSLSAKALRRTEPQRDVRAGASLGFF